MRVKFITTCPDGSVEVPETVGRTLLQGGYATDVTANDPAPDVRGEGPTTIVEDLVEEAPEPPTRKKKR